MTHPQPGRGELVEQLVAEVRRWPGVSLAPHRFGGTEFRLERGELGHVHTGGLLDVPLPRRLRDEVVAQGRATAHHILPESGWVSYRLRQQADLDGALSLLRLAYRRRMGAPDDGHPAPAPPPDTAERGEDALDEALEESFPASDPPGQTRR